MRHNSMLADRGSVSPAGDCCHGGYTQSGSIAVYGDDHLHTTHRQKWLSHHALDPQSLCSHRMSMYRHHLYIRRCSCWPRSEYIRGVVVRNVHHLPLQTRHSSVNMNPCIRRRCTRCRSHLRSHSSYLLPCRCIQNVQQCTGLGESPLHRS